MKNDARVMDVTSTLQGERVGMSIDESALAHIMSVLTDLYSDPELAVIREYSTNALDAHIVAGQKRPIEITLPSPLSPYFKVRDFGLGLDAGDIRDVYSRYGTSTKRESNDVVGMLGLGCKSALTYTDQFTLMGIKNGHATQVSISRDEDGGGSMTLVSSYDTDDPSGVEITIPAKSRNELEEKANSFFRFWEKGTVLVNGKEPERIDGIWISDDLLLTKDVATSTVVMGNVAYPLADDSRYNSHRTVAFVPIGSVHFTPSREALQMTTKTKETLAELKRREAVEKEAAFARIVGDAENRQEAIRLAHEVKSLGAQNDPVWGGEIVPFSFKLWKEVPDTTIGADGMTRFHRVNTKAVSVDVRHGAYNYGKGWMEADTGSIPSRGIDLWVEGYESEAFTPYKRQKMDEYLTQQGIRDTTHKVLFCKEIPAAVRPWLPRMRKWEDIDAIKITREKKEKTESGRLSGSYDIFRHGVQAHGVPADQLNTTNLFYFHGPVNHSYSLRKNAVFQGMKQYTVVYLPANRIDKFCRDFPMAKKVHDYCVEIAVAWEKNLSDDDRLRITIHDSRDSGKLKQIDPSAVKDPELVRYAMIAREETQNAKLVAIKDSYRGWVDFRPATWNNPLTKYPLIQGMPYLPSDTKALKHLYIYLNAAYAAGKEAK